MVYYMQFEIDGIIYIWQAKISSFFPYLPVAPFILFPSFFLHLHFESFAVLAHM